MRGARMSRPPSAIAVIERGEARLAFAGAWTIEAGARLEKESAQALSALSGATAAAFDLSGLEGLDTAGAWIISRTKAEI